MTFEVEEKKCIGCGICQSICPECFLIKDGIAKVLNSDPKNCDIKEICESCPCQAIRIKDKD